MTKTSRFGWCGAGQHDLCKQSFTDWNNSPNQCDCPCHTGKEK